MNNSSAFNTGSSFVGNSNTSNTSVQNFTPSTTIPNYFATPTPASTPASSTQTSTQTVPPPTANINASTVATTPAIQTTQVNNQVTNPNAFVGSLNTAIANTAGQPTTAEQTQSDLITRQAQAYQQLGTEGQSQLQEESSLGVPQYVQQIQDLNTSIAQQTSQFQLAEQNALHSGNTSDYGQGAYALAQNAAAIQLGAQAALLQAYQGNLTTAQNYAQHVTQLQYQPIQNQIDATQAQLTANQSLMTAEQADRAETLSAALTLQSQAVQQAQTDKSNIFQVALSAAQAGAPTTVATAISQATTPAQATAIYSAYMSGDTSAYQTATSQSGVVGGYDLSTYATNPTNVPQVNAIYTKLQGTLGTNPTADQIDNYIQTATNGKSDITGQMVLDAANQYDVDPTIALAIMQNESNFGTLGAASKTNNPGNVGTTSPSNENSFDSTQDGVDALMENLSKRQVQTPTSTQNTPTDPVSQANQTFTQLQQSAPPFVSVALQNSPATGAIFIDSSKVPTANQAAANAYAKANNIPILTPDQVATVKGADEAIQNIQNTLAPAWNNVSADGFFSRIASNISYQLGSKVQDDQYYQERQAYDSNQENLAQQIRALSQSAPKGSLLSTAEAALPSTEYDTTADGIQKFQKTVDLLNQTIQEYVPNASVATVYPNGGSVAVTDPNGVVHSFKDQASANAFKKAAGIQ